MNSLLVTNSKSDWVRRMAGQIVHPPTYVELAGPLIFLAGPIQGAPNWQSYAISQIQLLSSNVHIANPRRSYATGEFDYAIQVDWESHHLRRASVDGSILFWLSREVEHRCDRSYAQTTRFELAEWKMRHERDGTRLVIGIDEGFTGARYIRRRFAQDCPKVPIVESLIEACQETIRLSLRK